MTYTIEAVAKDHRTFDTKYGAFAAYKVRLSGVEEPVEISQKLATKPPAVGDILEGSIDMSAPFGPKFKKEFSPRPGATGGFKGSKPDDPYTMYLSYSKDIVVALMETGGFNQKKFEDLLAAVSEGGDYLYQNRPSNKDKVHPMPPDSEPITIPDEFQ